LVAAFNHQHIFLDPNPSPEVSFQERKRLFSLSRSTWLDYDASGISTGGGIFDRKAKEISISKQVQDLLGIDQKIMTGDELIRAILKMQVDFIWFGGIGTYIKADEESHFQASDPSNDTVRINASECRAKVITEGANLGITQKARILLSKQGIRLNTDFIDNSAGVNMSDYEVNIKIFLQVLLGENIISSIQERNILLEKATDEVTALVLANNVGQHRLLSMDTLRSKYHIAPFIDLLQHLIAEKLLDPVHESIPDLPSLEAGSTIGASIPRPVLAVIQSYVKMQVFNAIVKSEFMKDEFLLDLYQSYFPETLKKLYSAHFVSHRLRSEITATVLTNKIINQAGVTFFFEISQETRSSFDEIVKAYLMVENILQADQIRSQFYQDYARLIEIEDAIKTVVIELLHDKPDLLKLSSLKENWNHLASVADRFMPSLSDLILGRIKALEFSASLWVSESPETFSSALSLSILLDDYFEFQFLKNKLTAIIPQHKWEAQQKDILLTLLRHNQKQLMTRCMQQYSGSTLEELGTYIQDIAPTLSTTYMKSLHHLHHTADLSSLTVAISQLGLALYIK
jgi:glutamate dehydrogenase